MKRVICDTNIFIHHFRKDPATVSELLTIGSENVLLPSIVAMELFRGMSDKNELMAMQAKLKHYNLLHINTLASKKALGLIETYRLSHNLQLPDALIGAMAIAYKIPLFTYNVKDFKYLPGILLHNPSA